MSTHFTQPRIREFSTCGYFYDTRLSLPDLVQNQSQSLIFVHIKTLGALK